MIKSKGWNWKEASGRREEMWKIPSIESYYLLDRWNTKETKEFLDLGCGIGRHSILFGKYNFHVNAFDISEEAINRTKKWAKKENITIDYKIGDMLSLPYQDNQFDCIYCRNVISHTDTEGMKKIIKELYRVMKIGAECYLTLGSKDTREFKETNWPMIDENTKIKIEDGPENNIPHFYVDYKLILELFQDFKIIDIYQVVDYYEDKGKLCNAYHYHILIKK